MTETGGAEKGLSRDEALKIAGEKLRAKRVVLVEKPPAEPKLVKKEIGVPQLVAAHYEKLRHGLEEGTKLRSAVDQLERIAYDGAKVAGVTTGVADFILGGLFLSKAVGNVRPLRPILSNSHGFAVANTLGAIGVWRYAPVTMVARMGLNLTL
jgi:hypothetical protein